ncbi:hypothetical protein [Streptomyces sp. NPDC012510]|uniref:hypothetical protein n=1 Tax=Streptomyces sp. NPDC012510 TaxID=3364838 RepID=UPI0036E127A1
MKLAVLVAVLLIVGAVVAIVAQRRSVDEPGPTSDLDAEADANRWVVRLGGSLAGIDVRAQAGAGGSAAESLTDATECLRTARAQLIRARTSDEYAQVTGTAIEGLRHVHAARTALGMEPVVQDVRDTQNIQDVRGVRVVRNSERPLVRCSGGSGTTGAPPASC